MDLAAFTEISLFVVLVVRNGGALHSNTKH